VLHILIHRFRKAVRFLIDVSVPLNDRSSSSRADRQIFTPQDPAPIVPKLGTAASRWKKTQLDMLNVSFTPQVPYTFEIRIY
jgi:hypothetical protein